ncbi:hypothetical protein HRH25_09510 [Flavisolibacter sp. BT320]|nr:hypothetical protein [Flavisolibacter longurius]
MKVLKLSLLAMLATVFFACQKDLNSPLVSSNAKKGSPNSTSNFADYNIVTTVSPDGKTWTYTITRAKANAKNLSHLIIDLNNCGDKSATFADIVSATVNGAPADLSPSEGSGTGCYPQATTTNFIKINFDAATQWVLVITFDRGYEIFETATGWVKAGTSCNTGTIKAPGCPLTDYCSFSQGFFFANGATQNGAAEFWADGLTVGGITYTQAHGMNFWDIDKGRGGDQTMNAFFQLGAVRLSEAEAAVADDAALIEMYFTGLNLSSLIKEGMQGNSTFLYFDLPATSNGVTKAQAQAAGSNIGAFINANHCQ